MNSNNIVLAGKSSRFNTTAIGQSVVPVPPSPMVLQALMQRLTDLGQKVDALASRPQQVVEVRPVEVKQVEVDKPAKATEQKVNRKTLLSIFD